MRSNRIEGTIFYTDNQVFVNVLRFALQKKCCKNAVAAEYTTPLTPLQHFYNIFFGTKRKGLVVTTNTSPNVDLSQEVKINNESFVSIYILLDIRFILEYSSNSGLP